MSAYFDKERLRMEDYKDWLAEVVNTKFTKNGVCPPPKNRFALSDLGNGHWLAIWKAKRI